MTKKYTPILYDKDGVEYMYPRRTCKMCQKYPCFKGIEKKICDFAKYGCVDYIEKEDEEI